MKLDSHSNKVLITGINGFTGVHLEQYLIAKGFDVYGTVIDTPKSDKHLQCDIRNKVQVTHVLKTVEPDYIIHIAAISFVGESNTSLIYDVNVVGTENILHALVELEIKPHKVIIVSSATVYGNQGQEILDESMCPKPVNHYGISKLAMEHIATNYFKHFDIIITRPFNYTGVGQAEHFLIPKIVSHFKEKKKTIELGNLDVKREFNDVGYICDIYHRMLLSSLKSEVINIASNRGIKLLDVIEQMNTLAGYTIKVEVNPAFVRKDEIKSLTGSTKKRTDLLIQIQQKPFVETLKEMYSHS
jgi:nucleoside-diphosphate-sugar epimerase